MYNTIAQLQRIAVKPKHWIKKYDQPTGGYILYFNHLDTDDFKDFCTVQNARGKTKIYKTVEAALKDVYSVDVNATVEIKPESWGIGQ